MISIPYFDIIKQEGNLIRVSVMSQNLARPIYPKFPGSSAKINPSLCTYDTPYLLPINSCLSRKKRWVIWSKIKLVI